MCVSAVNVLVCLCSVSGLCIYCIEGRGMNYDPVCVCPHILVCTSLCVAISSGSNGILVTEKHKH